MQIIQEALSACPLRLMSLLCDDLSITFIYPLHTTYMYIVYIATSCPKCHRLFDNATNIYNNLHTN